MVPPKWRQVDAPGQARPLYGWCRPVSAPGPGGLVPRPCSLVPVLERGRILLTLPTEENSAGAMLEEPEGGCRPRGGEGRAGEGPPPCTPAPGRTAGCFVSAWGVFGIDALRQFCPETRERWTRSYVVLLGNAFEERVAVVGFSEEKTFWRKTQENSAFGSVPSSDTQRTPA